MKKGAATNLKRMQPILALTSGVLTNTISVQAFPNSYTGSFTDDTLILNQIADLNSWIRIFFIFFIFIFIWFLLGVSIPLIEHIVEKNRFWNKPRFSKKEIVKSFYDVNNRVKLLSLELQRYSDQKYCALYFTDLAICINILYNHFSSKAMPAKKVIKSSFRDSQSIENLGIYLSLYEFNACLAVIENLLDIVCKSFSTEDSDFSIDYHALEEKISELRKLTSKTV